jgi:succinate dehydrogenase/fumarate reductase flavoprotein subunit
VKLKLPNCRHGYGHTCSAAPVFDPEDQLNGVIALSGHADQVYPHTRWVPVHNERFETPLPGVFIAGSITGVEGAGVAEVQGRIAGLAAAGFLKLAAKSDLEGEIYQYQKDMIKARQSAIPFYPQIEAGRAQLNRIRHEWAKSPTIY